ncbi:MAG TPA: nuclear transport factor 2 family protein [Solirubrobacterales bacterium]|nr:nuclear transport factor 2 family protein [Solirubrobacterales bacterium]
MTDRASFAAWIEAYERAWRSAGTAQLAGLFAADASYRMSPYEEPVRGLKAIGALWERERTGPDEKFELSAEVVAIEGDTAVARAEVAYARGEQYRDLWIVRFGDDGRCREFEEWPFWPGKEIPALDPGRP